MRKLLFVLITAFFLSGHAFALNWSNGGGGGEAGTTVGGLTPDTIEAGDDGKYLFVDWSNSKIDYGAPEGAGDMLISVWDAEPDGFIDEDAGGTNLNTSASTGTARVDAGTWSINAAISGTTVDASTDFTIGGTVITDATITDDGTLVLAPTTAVSFSDKPITNVGSIALDSIASDGAAAALTITATAGQVVSVESVTMDGGALNATSIGAGTPGTIVGTTIDASTDFTVGGTVITDATITDDGTLTLNPTTLTVTADIATTAAQDWDLLDNNASALSFDATGKAGIIAIVTTDDGEGVTMSGTLDVTGAGTVGGTLGVTGVLTATAAGANVTFADGQLMDGSGITHTGATDEGWVLPTWADVSPTTDQAYIAWDAAGNALKIYDGGWLSFATAAAPLDAKYIVQQANATLTGEQSLGALGASGILYSTNVTGIVSIATEAQLETLMGLGFGASKVATSGYVLVADGTDFESVEMTGDVTIATGGATTVGDDSHAHVVGNIDAAASSVWIDQVSDSNGTGTMVFGTAPTFTTSIAFNAVTDTVAGIQNQNLVDKTAAETVSGIYTHSANIILDDGVTASPSLIFTDATNETWTLSKADAGNLDVDINNAADRTVDFANAGAGDVNVTIDGDLTVGGIVTITGVADDHYMDLVTNAATPPSAGSNSIYTVNNVIKFAEGGVEKDPVLEADSVTWTGTTHSFAGVTNMVLPTAAADASGEISMSAGNQLTYHDGTQVITFDTTGDTINYVLKSDGSGGFTMQEDATGGTTPWDSIGDPTTANAVVIDGAGETTTFTMSADNTEWLLDYTAAFTVAASPSLFKIIQQTGNAEAVTLVDIQASDSDVIVLAAGDGTNEWQVSQPGRLSNNGTADLNLAAATDLLIGGAQIDYDDLAGSAATASGINLNDNSPDANGEIGYASNVYTWYANSESMSWTAGTDSWTFSSGSGANLVLGSPTATTLTVTGAFTGGSATVDSGPVTLIQGAQTGDPQVILDLTADANGDFSVTTDTGDILLVSAADITLTGTNVLIGTSDISDGTATWDGGASTLAGFVSINSVTATELAELETIGATTISANQWAALGGIAETLAAAELDILDGVTAVTAELNYLDIATLGTGVASKAVVLDGSGNYTAPAGTWDLSGVTAITLAAGEIVSADIASIVTSTAWVGGGIVPDETQCAAADVVQINSGPYQQTIICADNDGSTLSGNVQMPDSWDAGNVTFELAYIQTAADTGPLQGDVTIQCRGAGETVNNTWESEVAMDVAGVTGSNAVDHLTSGNVSGTCVAGDTLYWRWQMDATGTTTAVATLHFVGMKMEYTTNVGD